MPPHVPAPTELRREMTQVGAALYAAGGLLVVLAAGLAGFEDATPWVVLATGAVAGVVAALMLVAARIRPLGIPQLSVLNALGTALVSVVVVAGNPLNAVFYVFVAAYAFFYLPRTVAIGELVLVMAAYATGLVIAGHDAALAQWVLIMGATTMLAVTIGALGHRLRGALAEQQRVVARLHELDELKASLVRAVSHEVRTPLACVIGLSSLLRKHGSELPGKTHDELTDAIVRNSRRLEHLLTDLLDVDELARGRVELRRVPADLQGLISSAVEGIDLDDRQLVVHVEPAVAAMDVKRARRAVEHLVANAVRHTPPGTSIWLSAGRVGDELVVVVEDDGPGIPDELKPAAVRPFSQGPASSRSHAPGTGMGLALVDEVARLHGGRLALDDRPGGGALVSLRLPAA